MPLDGFEKKAGSAAVVRAATAATPAIGLFQTLRCGARGPLILASEMLTGPKPPSCDGLTKPDQVEGLLPHLDLAHLVRHRHRE
ncbi:hypothetical protein, partial [Rhodococcus opacus]|uniref:hypothetical protein n=1 Tax=Rhodococcus opacus TaxID=37919 RepID=UPI001F1C80B6